MARGKSGDGEGSIHTNNGQAHILQRGNEGSKRPLDGPGGALRGRSAAELQIRTGKETMNGSTTDSDTTAREASGVCDAQQGGRQETSSNSSARVLDLLGDMAVGGYAGVTSESGEC